MSNLKIEYNYSTVSSKKKILFRSLINNHLTKWNLKRRDIVINKCVVIEFMRIYILL